MRTLALILALAASAQADESRRGEVVLVADGTKLVVALDSKEARDGVVDVLYMAEAAEPFADRLTLRGEAAVDAYDNGSLKVTFEDHVVAVDAGRAANTAAVTRVPAAGALVSRAGAAVAMRLDDVSARVDAAPQEFSAVLTPAQVEAARVLEAQAIQDLLRLWASEPAAQKLIQAYASPHVEAQEFDRGPPPGTEEGGGGCGSTKSCWKACTKGSCGVTCCAPRVAQCLCNPQGWPLCGCY